jgi:hypothetical protein
MNLVSHGAVPPDRLRALEAFVAAHTTTERVFRDLVAHGLQFDDIVAMDEYTLDLVVVLPDALTLVYDTT